MIKMVVPTLAITAMSQAGPKLKGGFLSLDVCGASVRISSFHFTSLSLPSGKLIVPNFPQSVVLPSASVNRSIDDVSGLSWSGVVKIVVVSSKARGAVIDSSRRNRKGNMCNENIGQIVIG